MSAKAVGGTLLIKTKSVKNSMGKIDTKDEGVREIWEPIEFSVE